MLFLILLADMSTTASDATIEFNGRIFPISSWTFSRHSRRFYSISQEHLDSSPLRVTISGNFEPDSVNSFINACQDLPPIITRKTAGDLVVLSREWHAPYLERQVTSFITDSAHRGQCLIPTLRALLLRNAETEVFEETLRNSFHEFLNESTITELPLSVIHRAFSFKNCAEGHIGPLFDLAIRLLDHFGPQASILFSTLDVQRLKLEQLSRLLNHENFMRSYLEESVLRSVAVILNSSLSQTDAFRSQFANLEQSIVILKEKARENEVAGCHLGLKGSVNHYFFPVQRGSVTNGILSFLTWRSKGNVHNLGVVNVQRSSALNGNYESAQSVQYHHDPNTAAEFVSAEWQNHWISFDFKARRVLLTGYSIRTRTTGGSNDDGDLTQWVIEVSDPGSDSWEQVDSRNVGTAHRPRRTVHTYDIANGRICGRVRLKNIGTPLGRTYFGFSAIEFFGTLIESSP